MVELENYKVTLPICVYDSIILSIVGKGKICDLGAEVTISSIIYVFLYFLKVLKELQQGDA